MTLVLIMSLIISLAGCQGEEVLAEVNGEKITRPQMDERMLFFDLLRPDFLESLEDESSKEYMEHYLLNVMVQNCLIKQELVNLELEVDEDVLGENYNLEIKSMVDEFFENEDEYYRRLEELNLSESFLKNLVRESLMFEMLYEYVISDISEQDVSDYFENNKEYFTTPAKAQVSHILVDTEEEIDKVVNRLNSGEDFNDLLEDESLYNEKNFTIEEDDCNFDQAFSQAVFQLEEGQTSNPVESSFGWHIIKVHKKEEKKEFTFEEIKDDVIELKREEVFYDYMNKLYEDANIKNYLEKE